MLVITESDEVFDADNELIVLVLSEEDKTNLANISNENSIFAIGPNSSEELKERIEEVQELLDN